MTTSTPSKQKDKLNPYVTLELAGKTYPLQLPVKQLQALENELNVRVISFTQFNLATRNVRVNELVTVIRLAIEGGGNTPPDDLDELLQKKGLFGAPLVAAFDVLVLSLAPEDEQEATAKKLKQEREEATKLAATAEKKKRRASLSAN